jgi:tetratricopeptide (TPR) repeat protein
MITLSRKVFLLLALAYAHAAFAQTHNDGTNAFMLEDWDKAINVYSAITKSNPADQSAWLSLGSALQMKGDQAKARDAYKSAFDAKNEGAYAFISNARLKMLDNDPTAYNEQFTKAAKAAKKDVNALRLIGESFVFYIPSGSKKPDMNTAIERLKAAVELNAKDYRTLMSMANANKLDGNGGEAARYFEFAEQMEKNNPMPPMMLSKIYRIGNLNDRALQYIDKSIACDQKFTPAYRFKADMLYNRRLWDKALDAYQELLANAAEPRIEDEMQIANCLYHTKKYKECSDLVESIIKKDGSKLYLRRLLAYCYYETGDFAKGSEVLTDYFQKVDPDKITANDYKYRGQLAVKAKGDTLAAIEDYKKAIQLDSFEWGLYKEISALCYIRRDYMCSATNYQYYVDSIAAPGATDLYNLGLRQFLTRDSLTKIKADMNLAKALEKNPKIPLAWLYRARMANEKDVTPTEIAANPELAKQYGKAIEFYEKYAELADADRTKNKRDLAKYAYPYMAYYYLVNLSKEKFDATTAKWLEVTAEDPATQTNIKEMQASYGTDTSAPATTPAGGGKN